MAGACPASINISNNRRAATTAVSPITGALAAAWRKLLYLVSRMCGFMT